MKRIVMTAAAVAVVLSGCAQGLGSGSYTREQARSEQNVRMGTVEAVRAVQIEGTKSQIGTAAGAIVGGIAGSGAGEGRGSSIGAVLGTVAGGVAGAAVEEAATRQAGVEIIIKLDSGSSTAITQATTEGETFQVGDRVRILSSGGVSRVTH
ncbi:MAG: hypothetical protein AB1513_03265 [Pseudomonadota bacterium]